MKYAKIKNRKKCIRTIFQLIFCFSVVVLVSLYLLFPKEYKEADKSKWNQKEGFIALSYVGVSRNDNHILVSKKKLDSHLKALYEAGYVTIGIDDILNFYNNNTPLPEKALFLTFEDGRKDSMIFAQPILEKYNFKATMLNYAGNVVNKDRLFLKGKDLQELDKNSYWEIGTNGYRFSYINVVEKDIEEYEDKDNDGKFNKKKFDYTHYLMDYLRDVDGVPTESKEEMEERINWDYDKMNEIYTESLGYNPKAYMIMHANKINGNINEAVEAINLENIYKYFNILFNREGSCYNTYSDSIYDLTRMQVGSDWSVNKLLMEIESWTDSKSPYVTGDKDSSSRWSTNSGVLESKEEKIILTSPKNQKAFSYLKGSDNWRDIDLSVYLSGREFGTQSIYLRYDNADNYIKLSLSENRISIIEKVNGFESILYSGPMPDIDKLPQTDDRFDKDRINGNEIENRPIEDIKLDDFNLKNQYDKVFKTQESDMEAPVSWKLDIKIRDNTLTVTVGTDVLVDNIEFNSSIKQGGIAIECFGNNGVIYDGIYNELTITPIIEE